MPGTLQKPAQSAKKKGKACFIFFAFDSKIIPCEEPLLQKPHFSIMVPKFFQNKFEKES